MAKPISKRETKVDAIIAYLEAIGNADKEVKKITIYKDSNRRYHYRFDNEPAPPNSTHVVTKEKKGDRWS